MHCWLMSASYTKLLEEQDRCQNCHTATRPTALDSPFSQPSALGKASASVAWLRGGKGVPAEPNTFLAHHLLCTYTLRGCDGRKDVHRQEHVVVDVLRDKYPRSTIGGAMHPFSP